MNNSLDYKLKKILRFPLMLATSILMLALIPVFWLFEDDMSFKDCAGQMLSEIKCLFE